MYGIAVIVLALALLMFLAFRGISLLILAPALALLAVAATGELPILGTYTQIFMTATGGFGLLGAGGLAAIALWRCALPRPRGVLLGGGAPATPRPGGDEAA